MADRVPRYAEVATKIRADITAGRLKPGDRIPTEREIMTREDVSVTVARAAVAQLRGEGLVESVRGHGSYVRRHWEMIRSAAGRYRRTGATPNKFEAAQSGIEVRVEADIRPAVQPRADVAERLSLPESGERVSEVIYHWYVDDELFQVSIQWEPLRITAGTPIERPSNGRLDSPDVITRMDSIGKPITHVDEWIRARPARAGDPIDVPEGTSLICITRTHYAGDEPVETADIIIRGDRVVIENRNDVPAATRGAHGAGTDG